MAEKTKILVVDDDADVRNLVKIMMEMNGYEVYAAENGEKALEMLETLDTDSLKAIFLDLLMPGMNGLDVLVSLKTHAKTQNIPTILLTTEGLARDMIRGYELGAQYYVPKPFTEQQLLYGLERV